MIRKSHQSGPEHRSTWSIWNMQDVRLLELFNFLIFYWVISVCGIINFWCELCVKGVVNVRETVGRNFCFFDVLIAFFIFRNALLPASAFLIVNVFYSRQSDEWKPFVLKDYLNRQQTVSETTECFAFRNTFSTDSDVLPLVLFHQVVVFKQIFNWLLLSKINCYSSVQVSGII